jgi:hypothetical protein
MLLEIKTPVHFFLVSFCCVAFRCVLKKMGLTKQYLRYAPQAVFNIVGSGRGGAVYLDAKGGLELISLMFFFKQCCKDMLDVPCWCESH